MSEIQGIKPPIKEVIPQKEQGSTAETPRVPEKVSPLKKAARAMRYVLDSTLDMLPFSTKSAAANEYLLEVAKDEKPEPSTYKESVEAQEKKDVIVEVYGDEGPLEVLKGRESKVGRKVAVLVLGGGNGGIYNAALLLEMRKQGLLENADGLFGVSSGAGNILAEGAGLGEDLVGVYGDENCRKVKVVDKKTKKEKEEGRFVKIPGADDPKGQINALKDAYVNGSDKPIISTGSVEEALRSRAEAVKKEKGIDLKEALKSNPRDIQVLVMDKNTTKSEFLDLKKVDDPIGAVGGAICVPGVSDKGSVNGKVDAAFGREPIPLDKIFAMGYTDVVVLANGPAGESGQFRAIQVFLAEIAKNENGYGYNEDIIQLIRGHKRGSEIAAARLEDKIKERDPNKRVVVIGSAKDGLRVEELCTDSEKIKKVYEEVRRLSGKRIFNRDVKLGSDKPADLRNAEEELKAMDNSGKPETGSDGLVKPVVETSSSNGNTVVENVGQVAGIEKSIETKPVESSGNANLVVKDREIKDIKPNELKDNKTVGNNDVSSKAEPGLSSYFGSTLTLDGLKQWIHEINPDEKNPLGQVMKLINEWNEAHPERKIKSMHDSLLYGRTSPLTLTEEIERQTAPLIRMILHPIRAFHESQYGAGAGYPDDMDYTFKIIKEYKKQVKAEKAKSGQDATFKVDEKKPA